MVQEKDSAAGPISRWFFTTTQNADSSAISSVLPRPAIRQTLISRSGSTAYHVVNQEGIGTGRTARESGKWMDIWYSCRAS